MHYIIFQISTLIFPKLRRISRIKLLIIFTIISIFVLSAQEGSWDYFGYKQYYECSVEGNCVNANFEESYRIVSIIFDSILGDSGFYLVIAFYCLTSLAIKISILKKYSRWFGISLFAYCSYSLFLHEMTQIRAALAIAFSWLAYVNYTEDKKLKTLLFLGLGTIFHSSAILGILALAAGKLSIKLLIYLCLAAIPTGQFLKSGGLNLIPDLPFDRINTYISAIGSEALVAPQVNVLIISIIVTIITFSRTNFEATKIELFALKSTLAGLIIYFAFFFIPIIPLRVFEFLSSMHPLLVAAAYSNTRSIFVRFILIFTFILLWLNLTIRNNARLDLIFDWQTIPLEYMTDLQLEQYLNFIQ